MGWVVSLVSSCLRRNRAPAQIVLPEPHLHKGCIDEREVMNRALGGRPDKCTPVVLSSLWRQKIAVYGHGNFRICPTSGNGLPPITVRRKGSLNKIYLGGR